ncbi:MAG: hypothetical protein JWQ11_4496 [Rhizobacter sp.]|nr:hypothetical protein [Rhizobacter sp.]
MTEADPPDPHDAPILDPQTMSELLAAISAQLQASEALKSSIVDYALDALISTDADGRIVEFNPAAQQMYGLSRSDVLGRSVSTVIMPERFHAAHQAGMARMKSGGQGRVLGKRLELFGLRADGSEFPMEMRLWRTHVGQTVFYTASMVDMSRHMQAQADLERHRHALRQSEKLNAMGSLLASVAHELNNPLAIVMGRAGLLDEKLSEARLPEAELAGLKDDVRRIREASERCGRIVRTFLDMARSRPPRRSPVALEPLVRTALDMLHHSLRSHDIEITLDLAPDLPHLMADGDQLGQVVLNLLVNAQQALADSSRPRRLSVSTGRSPPVAGDSGAPHLWLRIADNGPGVARELREKIFEPFFTTKGEGLGTGLGLSTSRALVRDHGGELGLEMQADAGSGACFELTLPLALG